jgi:hypothetical protein
MGLSNCSSLTVVKWQKSGSAMKRLSASDFRARRLMLEDSDFAIALGNHPGPTNLIRKATWESIVSLPDDVSIRTSDQFGPQLEQLEDYWGMWGRVVIAIQELSSEPGELPTAAAACDAADEFQAATYCALVGYYRLAYCSLRNVLEQTTIGTRLAVSADATSFARWRNGDERIGFGWAADTITNSREVRALEKHLKATVADSLFAQTPRGAARRLFAQLSKCTHGAAGFTDADFRESNGPIFVPETFLAWRATTLKTYALALHELRIAHALKALPYGPPRITCDAFRRRVVANIPSDDEDLQLLHSLEDFWRSHIIVGPCEAPRY